MSNVPKIPSYAVFTSQLIRFCQINSTYEQFKSDTTQLYNKFVAQNFDKHVLKAKFQRFYGDSMVQWSKFGLDIIDLLNEL